MQATLARVLASVALPEALPANARSANFQRRQAQRSARPSERDDCKRRPWARREELIDDHATHICGIRSRGRARRRGPHSVQRLGHLPSSWAVANDWEKGPILTRRIKPGRAKSFMLTPNIRVPSSTNVQRRSSRGTKPKSSSLLTNHMMVLALV